jgi:hypothetical protein
MTAVSDYPLKSGQCLWLRKTNYGLTQVIHSFFLLCQDEYVKCGLTQLKSGECVFVKYVNNIKGDPPLNLDNILDHGMFDTMTELPIDQCVYPSCPHPIVSMILMIDNNVVRTNCDELVEEFETKVREHGRINLNREGDDNWFLGVCYSFDKVSGTVSVFQEAYIDTLLNNYGLTDCNPCQLPIRPDVDLANIPLPSSPDPDNVREYTMLIGEFM